jgi:hypothetical protein
MQEDDFEAKMEWDNFLEEREDISMPGPLIIRRFVHVLEQVSSQVVFGTVTSSAPSLGRDS